MVMVSLHSSKTLTKALVFVYDMLVLGTGLNSCVLRSTFLSLWTALVVEAEGNVQI